MPSQCPLPFKVSQDLRVAEGASDFLKTVHELNGFVNMQQTETTQPSPNRTLNLSSDTPDLEDAHGGVEADGVLEQLQAN